MIFQQSEKQFIKEWYDEVKSKRCNKNFYSKKSERELFIENNKNTAIVKTILEKQYNDGYGYKLIAKDLEFSYSIIRKILIDYLKIDCRQGYNVITDKLRKIRSENVKGENSPFYRWPERMPHLLDNNSYTGIQGYYKNNNGDYVWLRSSWEYIYAKWLDQKNIEWNVEEQSYTLSNGETYRPDFFIYENKKLKYIVELKGQMFFGRSYKTELLKEIVSVNVVLIDDINPFIENESTYKKELEKWKLIKLSKEELKAQN
jgi:hypothetical protein